MIANNDVSIMNDSNTQTMANINTLQQSEMELFVNLEKGVADESISVDQQKAIVQKINEISQMRVNLYKNLKVKPDSTEIISHLLSEHCNSKNKQYILLKMN